MMLHSKPSANVPIDAAMCVQQDNAAALVPEAATAAETPPATQEDEHAQSKVCRQCESVSLIVPPADGQPRTDKQLCRSAVVHADHRHGTSQCACFQASPKAQEPASSPKPAVPDPFEVATQVAEQVAVHVHLSMRRGHLMSTCIMSAPCRGAACLP